MPQPIIIIETQNGILEQVYSNMDILFYYLNRDNDGKADPLITGPHEPWIVEEDFTRAFPNDPEICKKIGSPEKPTRYF